MGLDGQFPPLRHLKAITSDHHIGIHLNAYTVSSADARSDQLTEVSLGVGMIKFHWPKNCIKNCPKH